MAQVAHLRVYPVKGLDGVALDSAAIRPGGTLAHDREYALFDADDEVINGKRTARIHELATDFDPDAHVLTVETPTGECRSFDLDADRARAETFFGEWFDIDVTIRRDESVGHVDRPDMGPSVVSTATLRTVASWFDDLTVEGVRRRLRANVEVSGVPAFWEDRFVGDGAPTFEAGGVRFEGVTPCGRCVVPTRDPDTGEALPEFRERFVRKREETVSEWADRDAFEHFYTLMLIARVPEDDRGQPIQVGDEVRTDS